VYSGAGNVPPAPFNVLPVTEAVVEVDEVVDWIIVLPQALNTKVESSNNAVPTIRLFLLNMFVNLQSFSLFLSLLYSAAFKASLN
jgi:hypothetical protein